MSIDEMLSYIKGRCVLDNSELDYVLAYLNEDSVVEVYEELKGDVYE